MSTLPAGLAIAFLVAGLLVGFMMGFVVRARISRTRRRRWKQMIADGDMQNPTTGLKTPRG